MSQKLALVCITIFLLCSTCVTGQQSSCEQLENCLNDISNYVGKCGKQLKDMYVGLPRYLSTEACQKIADIFLHFGELQSIKAKQIANCINTTSGTDPSKCPKMNRPSSRTKRDNSHSQGSNQWTSSRNKVNTQCANGSDIVKEVKSKVQTNDIVTRQQVLRYVQQNCDGHSNLTINDMPVIGGDIKIENGLNKILNECRNGIQIIKNGKIKIENQQLNTRSDVVDYVKAQCQGNSTLVVNDVPNFSNSKFEVAIQKLSHDCTNSQQILTEVTAKFKNHTIFTRQQIVDYVATRCQGISTLQTSDIPSFFGGESTEFGKKLEASIMKIQRECTNFDQLLSQVRKQYGTGQLKSADEIVNYVHANCNGNSTLTVSDLPMGDCLEKNVRSKIQSCMNMVDGCWKAKFCNDCYELSDLHDAIYEAMLELSDAQAKCTSPTTT